MYCFIKVNMMQRNVDTSENKINNKPSINLLPTITESPNDCANINDTNDINNINETDHTTDHATDHTINNTDLSAPIAISDPSSQQLEYIQRNVSRFINLPDIVDKIHAGKTLRAYIGFEPVQSPSFGHLVVLLKIRDLIRANVDVTILIADFHAYLNKLQDRMHEKTAYYTFLVEKILERIGVNRVNLTHCEQSDGQESDNQTSSGDQNSSDDKNNTGDNKNLFTSECDIMATTAYTIIRGSDIQLKQSYIVNMLKASTMISIDDLKEASSELIKQEHDPKLSTLLYPIMQIIDETTIEADIQFGGLDQLKIFQLSYIINQRLGFDKTSYLMTPLIPSLQHEGAYKKMSSNDLESKIDFYDTFEVINKKINNSYVDYESTPENCACLAMLKYIIFEILDHFGEYESYNQFAYDWYNQVVSVEDFKKQLVYSIDNIISPIRKSILLHKELFDAAFV